MLLTEREARTKWCPMSRTGAYTERGTTAAIAVNRDPREEVQEGCACLASDCAVWRWGIEHDISPLSNGRRGFCGLAGKP